MVETPDDMLHSVPAKTTALLLMIGPFVVLGCFVVPSGYDWWIIDSLSNENARINMIGIALVPLIADDLFNLLWRDVPWISSRVVPALCMAMIFVTLWALLSRIHEAKWFSRSCVFASGIVFSLYLLTLPDPALAWYTASEALPLQLGVAALLLTLAALAAEDNPRWAVVPAFVAGALTATVGIMATAVLTAAALIRSPEKRRLHLCVAGVAAIGTLLAILHHQQLVPLTESRLPLGNALRRAGGMAGYAWVTWLLNPEVLLGGLLLVPPLAGRLKESVRLSFSCSATPPPCVA
jgi:hypothetical protein